MRPEAPELRLEPTVFQDPEKTQPSTPLAKGNLELVVEAVVERTLERLAVTWVPLIAARVVEAVTREWSAIKASQLAYETRTIALEEAVKEIRAEMADLRAMMQHPPTIPAPAPEAE